MSAGGMFSAELPKPSTAGLHVDHHPRQVGIENYQTGPGRCWRELSVDGAGCEDPLFTAAAGRQVRLFR